jgi:hypothetical protein
MELYRSNLRRPRFSLAEVAGLVAAVAVAFRWPIHLRVSGHVPVPRWRMGGLTALLDKPWQPAAVLMAMRVNPSRCDRTCARGRRPWESTCWVWHSG